MRKVAIISYGMTKVDRHWNKSLRDLFSEATLKALSRVDIPKVDAIFVGNMCASDLCDQNNIGTLIADHIGMISIPAYRIEAACGSGGAALHCGFMAVSSGIFDIVIVGGVEKLTDGTGKKVTLSLGKAADFEYEVFYGITFASLNALIMRRYMEVYKVPRDAFADFAVLMHKNGAKNPYAQLQFEIDRETVLKSEDIADPIKLYDCSPIGDGAAVVILCPLEDASKYSDSFVEIAGIGSATDTIDIASREDLLLFKSTLIAANNAYKMAKVSPSDIDLVEIHDAFTINAALSLEALGFSKRGEFDKLLYDGAFEPDGIIPVNLSGGLKSRGHPVGATGVYQVAEITMQLLGEAGKNQLKNAEIGLAQNMAGVASNSFVTILRRYK